MSIDPNNVRALINKGRFLSQLHKFEEAISNYDRALKIDPQNSDAFINKGLSLYNLGKNAEAITYFDKVLTVEPNNLLASSLKHRAELNLKGVPYTNRPDIVSPHYFLLQNADVVPAVNQVEFHPFLYQKHLLSIWMLW